MVIDHHESKAIDVVTLVVGPAVAVPDEVGDPQALDIELRLNGETCQRANTGEMIYDCADILQYASIGTTIEAGDVVSTGTPIGVGELSDGDAIHGEVESIGPMTTPVEERDAPFADVDVSEGGRPAADADPLSPIRTVSVVREPRPRRERAFGRRAAVLPDTCRGGSVGRRGRRGRPWDTWPHGRHAFEPRLVP